MVIVCEAPGKEFVYYTDRQSWDEEAEIDSHRVAERWRGRDQDEFGRSNELFKASFRCRCSLQYIMIGFYCYLSSCQEASRTQVGSKIVHCTVQPKCSKHMLALLCRAVPYREWLCRAVLYHTMQRCNIL